MSRLKTALGAKRHAEARAVLNWITGIRNGMAEPVTAADDAAEKNVDALFCLARRYERAAYMATLETPDADEFDS